MSGVKEVTVQAISPVVLEAAAARRRELARRLEEGRLRLAEMDRDLEQKRLRLAGLESQMGQVRAPLAGLEKELAQVREQTRGLERRRAAMRRDTISARDEAVGAVASAEEELRRLDGDLEVLRAQQLALQGQRAELVAAVESLHGPALAEARNRLQEAGALRDCLAASLEAFHARLQAWTSDPKHGAVVEALAEAAGRAGFRPMQTIQDGEEIRFVFQDVAERTFQVALRLAPPEQDLPSWVVTPGRFGTDKECVATFEDLLKNLAAQGVRATGRHRKVAAPGPLPSGAPVPLHQRVRE